LLCREKALGVKEANGRTLTQEMEESGESTKNKRGDPRRGLYLLFPVSNCHTTITPSKPPTKQKICLRIIKPKKIIRPSLQMFQEKTELN